MPTTNTKPTVIHCMQCDDELIRLRKPRLYCSIACEQEAELVRYMRRCKADGRIEQEDVQIAIQTRFAHIAAGGYDKKARKLSAQQRSAVVSQSEGLCVRCGKPGVEVDHIAGPSDAPANLQLLCKECHERKTFGNIVPVLPGSDLYEQVKALRDRIAEEVESPVPLRPCHNETTWATQWRAYLKERSLFVLPR